MVYPLPQAAEIRHLHPRRRQSPCRHPQADGGCIRPTKHLWSATSAGICIPASSAVLHMRFWPLRRRMWPPSRRATTARSTFTWPSQLARSSSNNNSPRPCGRGQFLIDKCCHNNNNICVFAITLLPETSYSFLNFLCPHLGEGFYI